MGSTNFLDQFHFLFTLFTNFHKNAEPAVVLFLLICLTRFLCLAYGLSQQYTNVARGGRSILILPAASATDSGIDAISRHSLASCLRGRRDDGLDDGRHGVSLRSASLATAKH